MRTALTISLSIAIAALILSADPCPAGPRMPQAPSSFSWFPHGYGGNMDLQNSSIRRKKSIHGLRNTPSHTGAVSQPLWGWDVNGYFRGPQVPEPDPANCQLPIGLIYPANAGPLPRPRKGAKMGPRHMSRLPPAQRVIYPGNAPAMRLYQRVGNQGPPMGQLPPASRVMYPNPRFMRR